MSRDQVYLGYAMARPDDKPRALSSSLEYCRGAEEEDEVNFRSSESRTLSVINCYAECRRKSSSIKGRMKSKDYHHTTTRESSPEEEKKEEMCPTLRCEKTIYIH